MVLSTKTDQILVSYLRKYNLLIMVQMYY